LAGVVSIPRVGKVVTEAISHVDVVVAIKAINLVAPAPRP
jgi:hypothetical protein